MLSEFALTISCLCHWWRMSQVMKGHVRTPLSNVIHLAVVFSPEHAQVGGILTSYGKKFVSPGWIGYAQDWRPRAALLFFSQVVHKSF